MAYTVVIAPRAKKQILGLPQHVRDRIGAVLDDVLALDPYAGNPLKGRLKGFYAYRVGDYRILYDIRKAELIVRVVLAMHRRDAYKRA